MLPLDGLRSFSRLHGIGKSLRLVIAMICHVPTYDLFLLLSSLDELLLIHSTGDTPINILLNHLIRPHFLSLQLALHTPRIPLTSPNMMLLMLRIAL